MTFKGRKNIVQHEKHPEEGYNLYASSYAKDERKLNEFDLKMLMRALRSLQGKKVLDLGCGNGRLAGLLKKRDADDVTGVDISEEMLRLAEKTGIYTSTLRADATQELSLPWNTFDVVLCSMLLVHIPQKDLPTVCAEMYRVLKPGGDVYLVNLPQRRAPRLVLDNGETIFIASYVHSDAKVMDALEDAGFEDLMIDENKQGRDHYATLIKATKPR